MATDQAEPSGSEIPGWFKTALPMIAAAIASSGIFSKRSPVPVTLPEDFVRRLSEDVSRRVTEKQTTDEAYRSLLNREIVRALREETMNHQEREKHNYHYIRYGMLFAYVVGLSRLPEFVRSRLDWPTIRGFGIMFTFLAIIIDWRNYKLYREELGKQAWPPGPVTCAITAFYIVVLLWFIFTHKNPMVVP